MQRKALVTALWLVLGCDVGSSASEQEANAGAGGSAAGTSTVNNAGNSTITAGTSAGGAASGTASGSSGSSGSGGAGVPTTPAKEEDFHLLFRDDFETLDAARWQLMTHSWDGNLALFSTSAALIEEGTLRITLTPAPEGTVD